MDPAPPSRLRDAFSPPALIVALAVWALSTFGHGKGLEWAGQLFAWARAGNNWLSADGGTVGQRRLELLLGGVALSIAAAVLATVGWRLRKAKPAWLLEAAIPWLVWALLVRLIWTCYIVYATELMHFAQYALVGFLVCWALGRGRYPVAAFVITVLLGFLDEVWQHYGLHAGEMNHWMDWSDPVLDALGATGGILPFVTLARFEETPLPDTRRFLRNALTVAACLLLPLLLLDPVGVAEWLGHYRYVPYWGEYENNKPTHWPHPGEGIPLLLSMTLVLGILLEPRRRGLPQSALLFLLLLLSFAVQPPSRRDGMAVHEVVPAARALRAEAPIAVDGVLEQAWERAERLGPFVISRDGGPARQETHARLLWDDERLYVAFEVQDDDIWGREVPRDEQTLPGDEVVELFLDDGGDEHTYYEIEVSPHNAVYDLFCFIAEAPIEHNPIEKFIGLPHWDAKGLQTAVGLDGTLDLQVGGQPFVVDRDRGYVVELSIPWSDLQTIPYNPLAHRTIPPKPGDVWRMGLYRVDRPRLDPKQAGEPGATVDLTEAQRLIGCDDRRFQELLRRSEMERDAAGRIALAGVLETQAKESAELQAWAPTWVPSFHVPRWFGTLEFVGAQPAEEAR